MAINQCLIDDICKTDGRYDSNYIGSLILLLLKEFYVNGIATTGGGGGGGGSTGLGTETETTQAGATSSFSILSTNASRKAGSFIQNNTDVDMWLTVGATAVVGQGKLIGPYETYVIQSTNQFKGILATAKTTGQINTTEVA